MKKLFLLIITVFVLSTNSYAMDVLIGIKAGGNLSNLHFSQDKIRTKQYVMLGFEGGITLDFGINDSFFVLSGIDYTIKGAKTNKSSSNIYTTYSPMYLQLPVHIAYKLNLGGTTKLVFGAGPYFAYGIGGKTRDIIKDGKNKTVNSKDFFSDHKKFDFGAGLSLGLEVNILSITVGYDWGFLNIAKSKDNKQNNRNTYLTVGLKF
jgi:hypothetical protein